MIYNLIILFILLAGKIVFAATPPHPFYLGISGGYGSTTWDGLVPKTTEQNLTLAISTPIAVREGGSIWGLVAGFEFTPFFALEATYRHYPDAFVTFDPDSLFALDNEDRTTFRTRTDTSALMAKIMLVVPETQLRVYSSAGVANVHRRDEILKGWETTPTFGIGLNYDLNEHLVGELGANYTAGYGEAELSPSDNYIPFLYSCFVSISYRF